MSVRRWLRAGSSGELYEKWLLLWAVGSVELCRGEELLCEHLPHEEEVQVEYYIAIICAVQTKTMKDAVVSCS